jgi:hypothetical protein
MKYFKDQAGKVYGYDDADKLQRPLIDKATAAGWVDVTANWPPAKTLAQLAAAKQAAMELVIQRQLDGLARAWGYDSIISAASYSASAVPRFREEAAALVAWRDAVWVYSGALLADVLAGKVAAPADDAALIAGLPVQPARPVVA